MYIKLDEAKAEAKKYRGVTAKRDWGGAIHFYTELNHNHEQVHYSRHTCPKDAAKTYDRAVIKNGLYDKRGTNFLKRI